MIALWFVWGEKIVRLMECVLLKRLAMPQREKLPRSIWPAIALGMYLINSSPLLISFRLVFLASENPFLKMSVNVEA